MTKIAGSGSGSIIQRHGSADPDPDPLQNVMDPQHCSSSIHSDRVVREECSCLLCGLPPPPSSASLSDSLDSLRPKARRRDIKIFPQQCLLFYLELSRLRICLHLGSSLFHIFIKLIFPYKKCWAFLNFFRIEKMRNILLRVFRISKYFQGGTTRFTPFNITINSTYEVAKKLFNKIDLKISAHEKNWFTVSYEILRIYPSREFVPLS